MKREIFSGALITCALILLLLSSVATNVAHAQSGMLQRGTVAAAQAVSTPEVASAPDQKNRPTEDRNTRPATEASNAANKNANASNAATIPVSTAAATTTTPASAASNNTTAKTPTTTVAGTSANNNNITNTATNVAAISNNAVVAATDIYRVGTGDVLDIRIVNQAARDSTLYTIQEGGMLEYPLIGDATKVAGMSPEQIGARIEAELKRRAVFPDAKVTVNVRDYQSHTVIISGMVDQPGTKYLRRDAVPLYVVLAEAQPKLEAGQAIITARADGQKTTVDFANQAQMNTLVRTGDFIQVGARPPQFYFIGGQVAAPGQKDFQNGMTLTQALLASGGTTRFASERARIARQGADGKLVSTEYSLRDIEKGKIPDPVLQSGDRIEIGRTRW